MVLLVTAVQTILLWLTQKNIAAAVNTWQSDSSQMALSNQATHINQEIS